jgi:hypothetical protein
MNDVNTIFDNPTDEAGPTAFEQALESLLGLRDTTKNLERYVISFNNLIDAEAAKRGQTPEDLKVDNYKDSPWTFEESLEIHSMNMAASVGGDIINCLDEIDRTLYKIIGPALLEIDKSLEMLVALKAAEITEKIELAAPVIDRLQKSHETWLEVKNEKEEPTG